MATTGPEALREALRASWHRFVDEVTPLRPALHGHCRRLAGNLFDAEDLVQDTLLRAFGRWGVTHPPIRDPKAYLLRTATNVWIDGLRRRETEAAVPLADPDATAAPGGASPGTDTELRLAGARLLERLAPQERAALVLREGFEMGLDEIAGLLATTTGAVKAALHRGRDRVRAPAVRNPSPSPALVDRFIERFHAKDVPGLLALMREGAAAENVGNSYHVGTGEDGVPRFANALVHGHPEWPAALQWQSARMERREHRGEPIALYLVTRKGRESLLSVLRFEEAEGQIARIRSYGFCPDTIRALGEELGLPVYTGLYRAPE